MQNKHLNIFLLTTLILCLFSACKKDIDFNTDSSLKLEFSADTLYFDTVFTTIGSVTLQLRVYNPSNDYVKISSARLVGNTASNFKINVNGLSGTVFSDIELAPKDSIFIFAEVCVDPRNESNPFIIEDSIEFFVNGNRQYVNLVAYGQDAYFHYPDHPQTKYLPAYSLVSGTWKNDKPHVIYGYAVVDEDCTLVIPAGTKVFMHNNASLWIYDGGSLKIEGELKNEVVFTGDRLDDYYKDLPGMWGKIWLSAGSLNNEINYAIIKNGNIGIQIDTLGASSNPTLKISNTIIDNMSAAAMYAQGSFITATNCVFGNAGVYSLVLSIGGKYDFKHCTIGNFWTNANRTTPALVINNYYKDVNGNIQIRDIESAYFGNCIIYGKNEEEILLDKNENGQFNYKFENCLLKTSANISSGNYFLCNVNYSPDFTATELGDFSLKETSFAIDKGNASISISITTDIAGNARNQGLAPDLGAFEKQ